MRNLFFLCLFCLPFVTQAQLELGLMVGVSNYTGDLAPETARTSLSQTHAAFGGFVRHGFGNYFTARLSVFYGTISGDDAKSEIEGRRQRNLSFRSRMLEAGLTGEFNILGYRAYNYERVFSPYIFAGINAFRYNPEAFYDNQWNKLQPLGTEGQGMPDRPDPYKLIDIAIPFGLGVKYAINDYWNIGIEVGFRKTFTDYLDDVSTTYVEYNELLAANGELAAALGNRSGEYLGTEPLSVPTGRPRGNADNDDWYFISGVTLSYNITDNGLVGARRKNGRKSGCPTF